MKQLLAITRKELDSYFGSPMALIFVGVFLITVLFSFFWVSGFFARGIADVRPLFQWMPLLLILLIATLTMRSWSEEQQTGTLEMLFTMPINLTQLVLGKFLAVLALVAVALALTLMLPITVAINGNLDFGPVIGGYLAAILMACAYIAIGLFVSSRTDNQIVSLLITGILCGAFYLIGSPTITTLASTSLGELLRALGTGSRFESIQRGVIDLRDLLYYVTLTVVFLALNLFSLDARRWGTGDRTRSYRFNHRLAVLLVIVNLIAFNVLMARVGVVRADLTQSGEYTLAPITRDLLASLQEPLLVRGYFSEENHPLLAPLIPTIRDTLEEYRLASNGKLQLEFVDPIRNPELEQEANQTYGIRPSPLQVSDRGKTSVINAYLDILIRYGDQNATLNLLRMIDVRDVGGEPDVRLRNLEYDLTSTLQRVVYGFQSIDAVLAGLEQPATMTLYVTPGTLPAELTQTPQLIESVAQKIAAASGGKFVYKTVDMTVPNSGVSEQDLLERYQIQPISAGLFSSDRFLLHMVIETPGKQPQVLYPSGEIGETQIRSSIEAALKRLSPGSLNVVGLWTPPPQGGGFSQQPSLQQYQLIGTALRENYEVRTVSFSDGEVPTGIDALVIVNPQAMTDLDRYAIDQFLMRGGAVFVALSNFQLGVGFDGNIALQPVENGLQEMLASYGITVNKQLVMDTRNAPFPITVQRNAGGVTVQEVQAINYPPFVDVRADGMDQSSPVVAQLQAVTLNWVSPVTLDAAKTASNQVTILLKSSPESWLTTSTDTQPNFTLNPDIGFPIEGAQSTHILAVAIRGSFNSFFSGKPAPFITPTPTVTPTAVAAANTAEATQAATMEATIAATSEPTAGPSVTPTATATPDPRRAAGFAAKSPVSTRLIVVGSAEFLNDNLLDLARSLGGESSRSGLKLVQNSIDWFVQDTALAAIRAKGAGARLLNPMSEAERSRWEVFNYVAALAALIALGVIWQVRKRTEQPMPLTPRDGEPVAPEVPPSVPEL